MTRPPNRLYEDVTYLAYHLHWSLDEILDLAHPVRERFRAEVARLAKNG